MDGVTAVAALHELAGREGRRRVVALVGNPNCGKTTVFNVLTGLSQRTGNWPGVTVERKSGRFEHAGVEYEVVDLPGIYSLSSLSRDEEVARAFILSRQAGLYVNIVDASNPDRNLYLTSRLLEMGIPVVVALNMTDAAEEHGIAVDVARLSGLLGCPVIPMVASRGEGIASLKAAIAEGCSPEAGCAPGSRVRFPDELAESIVRLGHAVRAQAFRLGCEPSWFAMKLLENDQELEAGLDDALRSIVDRERTALASALGEDADIVIADAHYQLVSRITAEAVTRSDHRKKTLSDKIDAIVLHRYLGIPFFLGMMYLVFVLTIKIGGAFIDFFDIAGTALFVDGFGLLLSGMGAPDWVRVILSTGLGGAVKTMATFIPPIGCMFICLSILEDSGYMARAAYVMDRGMRAIGLPGKAFIPLLVGFGCNVPAIMSTRTISDERDRIMTVMMTPFMSCGARMPVYALFAAAFFPTGGQNLVFLLYLIGIGVAVLTGFILKRSLLKGDASPFIMEMPPYHLPTLRGVIFRVADRLASFLVKAGKVLVPVMVVLGFMNSIGTDGSFGNEDRETSVLSATGKALVPLFRPLGISEANWPAAVGLFTGVFAKEAVVGTLDNLYSGMDAAAGAGREDAAAGFSMSARMQEAFGSIPANLSEVAGSLLDPLGMQLDEAGGQQALAEKEEVGVGIFGSMVRLFDGRVGAFAYLVFVLLYFPCVAAIAAVYRETDLGWTLFAGAWTTGLAYAVSVMTYQIGTWGAHPLSSALWVGVMLLALLAAVALMRFAGRGSLRPGGVKRVTKTI